MNNDEVKRKVTGWLEEQFIQQPEFFLVDLRVQHRKISVFLDGDKGISIDKCAEFSKCLEHHLDGEMLMGDNYLLEVSSPGLDNSFRVKRQYRNGVGKEVSVIKYDGTRLDGKLTETGENKLKLETIIKEKGKPEMTKLEEVLLSDIKSTKLKINF